MYRVKQVPAAITVAMIALSTTALSAHAAEGQTNLGRLRGSIDEIRRGFTLSVNQDLRFDDNLVRTASDAETLSVYGTDDPSDLVSTTDVTLGLVWRGNKTEISAEAAVGYAHYFNFEDFSGVVTSGQASIGWNFTDRCRLSLRADGSRELASFIDVDNQVENYQVRYGGNANVGCFLLDRVRLDGGVSTTRTRNEENTREINDIDDDGWSASIAFVSAQRNEIGLRYRTSDSSRPNDPTTESLSDEIIEGFLIYNVGEKLALDASLGLERQDQAGTSETTDRTNSSLGLTYAATDRLSFAFDFLRDIENATDLNAATRERDSYSANISWRLRPRITTGTFFDYAQDQFDAGTGAPLTGTSDETMSGGVFLNHTLFDRLNFAWRGGFAERSSDAALRDFESLFASVSIGLEF